MISSKVVKYISSRILNTNFSQYRWLRRVTKNITVDIQSEDVPCDEKLNVDIKYKQASLSQTQDSNFEPLSRSTSQAIEEIDEKLLSRADEQSKELAQYVPKENFTATFNLAAYINKSETLQQLHKLGVDFSKVEKRKGIGQFVLQLDFERDIKSHLTFLHDVGVPPDKFGEFLTKNPLIFKEDLDDLQTRLNYLEAKKFKKQQIQRVCTLNPYWLMFSTKRIDKRLGYFQQNFKLTGDDIRHLATKLPRLITYKMDHIRENTFCIKEEMGFQGEEVKCLLLSKPKLWMMNREEIIERFDYAHNIMKLSHEMILLFPEILISRLFRIKERNEFLKSLGKAQYDINKDEFISPKKLVEGPDEEFVQNVCKTSIKEYEIFLRKL